MFDRPEKLTGNVSFQTAEGETSVLDEAGRHLGYAVKVNLPYSQDAFAEGNGESCWVVVDDATKRLYDQDHSGGQFQGYLLNDSYYYPELPWGSQVAFEMRGENKPVAFLERLPHAGARAAERRAEALKNRETPPTP